MPDRCSDDGNAARSSSILNGPVPNAEIGRRRAAHGERFPHHECGESHSPGVPAAAIDENYLDQIYSIVANQDLLDSWCNRLRIAATRFTALRSGEELDAALLGKLKERCFTREPANRVIVNRLIPLPIWACYLSLSTFYRTGLHQIGKDRDQEALAMSLNAPVIGSRRKG